MKAIQFLIHQRLKLMVLIPLLLAIAFSAYACDTPNVQTPTQTDVTQFAIDRAGNVWTYVKGKLKPITDSSEIENIIERTNRETDPNHVWYIYLFSLDGKLIYYTETRGKATSTDSTAVPPTKNDCTGASGTGYSCSPTNNPGLDASYGANEPGIFFFVRNTVHTLMESNLYYLVSDGYIPITQKPTLEVVCDQNQKCRP